MRFLFYFILVINLFINVDLLSQEIDDNDFGVPGFVEAEVEGTCDISDDKFLLELLDFKLKKFDPNPKDTSGIGSAGQMTPQDVKQAEIRY